MKGSSISLQESSGESFGREVLLQYLAQSTKGSALVEESFGNSNFGESSPGMPGCIQLVIFQVTESPGNKFLIKI